MGLLPLGNQWQPPVKTVLTHPLRCLHMPLETLLVKGETCQWHQWMGGDEDKSEATLKILVRLQQKNSTEQEQEMANLEKFIRDLRSEYRAGKRLKFQEFMGIIKRLADNLD